MRLAPDLPASRAFQVCSTPQPSGVTMPRPVMTTRRMIHSFSRTHKHMPPAAMLHATRRLMKARGRFSSRPRSGAQAFVDELDGIADGLNVFSRVVGDFDIELLFEG